MKKKAFSLLEVLFSITFLVIVGTAVLSLNVATLKLITNSEIKTTAQALNDEVTSFLAVKYRADITSSKTNFAALIKGLNWDCTDSNGCYLNCSSDDLSQDCSVGEAKAGSQLGRSRLVYYRQLFLSPQPSGYTTRIEISWGNSFGNQIVSSYTLQ